MFKKQIALLLASAAALMLCACGAPAETPSSVDGAPPAVEVPPVDPETAAVEALLVSMTVEEKVGQLFFVRCPAENAAEDVAAYAPGGVLLFGRDFKDKTRDEVCAMTGGLQAAAKIPLMIGADEEGGTVVRASANPNLRERKFLSPQAVYKNGGIAALAADAAEKSAFLLDLGVNVNFAPVCDVSTNAADYIYPRTLGLGAEETANYVSVVVGEMEQVKMGGVLKHFPGYGSNVNTHTGISLDERPMETFETVDLLPFRAGIAVGAPAVLVSHNIVACMDDTLPASLSPAVHALLREDLGFEGVIMTDDLDMDALAEYAADGSAATLAVLAGNDMIVSTDYRTEIPTVIAAVKDGTVSEAQLDASVGRILRWKFRLGLLEAA